MGGRASSLFFYCLIGSAAGALDSGEIVGIAGGATAGVGLIGATAAAVVKAEQNTPTEAPGYEEPLTDAPAGAPVPAATTLPPLRVVNAKEEGSSNNVLKILGLVAALGVFGAVGAGIAKKVKDSQGVEEQEEDP